MRAHHFTAAPVAVLLFVVTAQAQSLADLAKKEEERRKTAPETAKVYTNKDLNAVPAASAAPPPPASAKPAPDTAKDAAKEKDTKGATEKDAGGKDVVKDKAYWAGRLKALQDQVDQNQTYVEALQTRINALTTDFVNRDDPAQRSTIERDRQKALAELTRLKQTITDGKKAVANLEEDARRAGVPPGWLR
jgi:chromosome segregation ATPase